jgi:hypothetical protein
MYCVHFCLGNNQYLGFVPPPHLSYCRPHIICSSMMLLELV